MFSRGKVLTATLGAAALSGTLFVPASNLLASPAPAAVIEAPSLPQLDPAPAQPAPVAAPAQPATEAEAPAAPAASARPEAPVAPRAERTASVGDRELECMTRVILYEAGSEPRAGQVAVAQVVLNRMRSGRFPRTICGVIHQRGQFSAIRSFNPPRNARWNRAMALARDVIDGHAPVVGNALYFHAARVRPAFASTRARVARIGNHIFYR